MKFSQKTRKRMKVAQQIRWAREKLKKNPPSQGRLGKLICIDKQGLAKLLHDYEVGVKEKDEILPFLDRYFECLRRFNLGVK